MATNCAFTIPSLLDQDRTDFIANALIFLNAKNSPAIYCPAQIRVKVRRQIEVVSVCAAGVHRILLRQVTAHMSGEQYAL
jgi:hypothetical protein